MLAGCDKAPEMSHVSKMATLDRSVESQHLKEHIGWIHGACLAIQNGKIKFGTPVQMVLLSKPQTIANTRVMGVAGSNSECPPLLNDRGEINKQDGRFFYRLDMNRESLNTMAIGLVSASVQAKKLNSRVEFDVNHDGVAEVAGACLTSEGIQFYISSSGTFGESAEWSDYYYLGYDNKPTCP